MITPLTFLDELEKAFPELGRRIADARADFDPETVVVDVYGWVGLLRRPMEHALADGDEAMLQRCFDFLELLYRKGNGHVLMPVSVRIFERMDSPAFREACQKYGGPYTLMAQKFDAEGIAPD